MVGTYPLSTLPLSTLEAVVSQSGGNLPQYQRPRRKRPEPFVYVDNVGHAETVTPAPVWLRYGGITSQVERRDDVTGVAYKLRLRGTIDAVIDRVDNFEGVRSGVKAGRINTSRISWAGSVNAVKVGVKTNNANYAIERFADVTPTRASVSSGFVAATTHRLGIVSNTVSGVSVGYLGAVLVKAPVVVEEPLQMVGRREARRAAMQIRAAWKFAGKVDPRLLEAMENGNDNRGNT